MGMQEFIDEMKNHIDDTTGLYETRIIEIK